MNSWRESLSGVLKFGAFLLLSGMAALLASRTVGPSFPNAWFFYFLTMAGALACVVGAVMVIVGLIGIALRAAARRISHPSSTQL
jgi:hypothetical protein